MRTVNRVAHGGYGQRHVLQTNSAMGFPSKERYLMEISSNGPPPGWAASRGRKALIIIEGTFREGFHSLARYRRLNQAQPSPTEKTLLARL